MNLQRCITNLMLIPASINRSFQGWIRRLVRLGTTPPHSHRIALHWLEREIARARACGREVAVMMVELDRFKELNDLTGYAAGDQVISEVALRLQRSVATLDCQVQILGNRLILCLPVDDEAEIECQAWKVREALELPVRLPSGPIGLSASVGVSISPRDGGTAEALVRSAEIAARSVGAMGGNGVQRFDASMWDVIARRRMLEAALRSLPFSELKLIYQPQVDPATEQIIGVEALLRWHHPVLGLISPTEFIPIAEESGSIIPITEWVLRTACAQNRAWRDAGLPPIRMAVNLSACHFAPTHHPGLLRCIRELLEEHRLPPESLELEITESMAVESLESAATVLDALVAMGIGLAIDDFGAGFSSLRYLKRFPVRTVKLDRSFIQDIETSQTSQVIVESILQMSRALRVQMVVEGVETQAQLEFLRSRGCDLVQGYLFSRPVQATELAALLVSMHPVHRPVMPAGSSRALFPQSIQITAGERAISRTISPRCEHGGRTGKVGFVCQGWTLPRGREWYGPSASTGLPSASRAAGPSAAWRAAIRQRGTSTR